MRYALRKRQKIAEALGADTLKRIKDSLDAHFKDLAVVQAEQLNGDLYPTIVIDDKGHTCGLIAFFVTAQQFDVVHLAFKEFIN